MTESTFWRNFDRNTKAFWHKSGQHARASLRGLDQHAREFSHRFGHHLDGNLFNSGESLRARARRHWAVLLNVLLLTVGVIIVVLLLSLLASGPRRSDVQWYLWFIVLGAVLYFAWRVLGWRNEIIYVTATRLMVGKGIFARKNCIIPIKQVANFGFERTVVSRLLGYGTLRVESAGQRHGLETIEYLPQPVFLMLSSLVP